MYTARYHHSVLIPSTAAPTATAAAGKELGNALLAPRQRGLLGLLGRGSRSSAACCLPLHLLQLRLLLLLLLLLPLRRPTAPITCSCSILMLHRCRCRRHCWTRSLLSHRCGIILTLYRRRHSSPRTRALCSRRCCCCCCGGRRRLGARLEERLDAWELDLLAALGALQRTGIGDRGVRGEGRGGTHFSVMLGEGGGGGQMHDSPAACRRHQRTPGRCCCPSWGSQGARSGPRPRTARIAAAPACSQQQRDQSADQQLTVIKRGIGSVRQRSWSLCSTPTHWVDPPPTHPPTRARRSGRLCAARAAAPPRRAAQRACGRVTTAGACWSLWEARRGGWGGG